MSWESRAALCSHRSKHCLSPRSPTHHPESRHHHDTELGDSQQVGQSLARRFAIARITHTSTRKAAGLAGISATSGCPPQLSKEAAREVCAFICSCLLIKGLSQLNNAAIFIVFLFRDPRCIQV